MIREFQPESRPTWTIKVKMPTGTQAATMMGEWMMQNANQGIVAIKACKRHIMAIDGEGITYDMSDDRRIDALPVAVIFEVAGFLLAGVGISEADAKN